jgi:hypothetical protein
MKAYDYAMALIFINAGFAIVFSLDIFGTGFSSQWSALTVFTDLEFTVPGTTFTFNGVLALAGVIAIASATVLGTKVVSPAGIATGTFAAVFWGAFITAFITLTTIPLPGLNLWITIFTLSAVLIFVVALVQMQTGGQKSHV